MDKKETEAQFFYRVSQFSYHNGKSAKQFFLVSQALENQTILFLNLEEVKKQFDEIYRYIILLQRFEELKKHCFSLESDYDGFYFDSVLKFDSLDEVERALKNKAFL